LSAGIRRRRFFEGREGPRYRRALQDPVEHPASTSSRLARCKPHPIRSRHRLPPGTYQIRVRRHGRTLLRKTLVVGDGLASCTVARELDALVFGGATRSPAPPLRPGLTPRGPRPRRSPPAPTTRASLARPRGSSCPIRGGTDRSSRHAHARDPLGCSTRGIGAQALAEEQSVSLLRFCLHCYTHHQGCCPKADSRRNLEPSKRARNTQRYREAKQAARRRDGERCTRCGSGDRLEVHHIVPLSEGGDAFALSNLTTLCHDCHRMTYGGWESIEGRRRKHPAPRFSRKTLSNRGAPSEKSNVGPDKRLRALSWLTRPFELVRRPNNVDISLRL
jgi:5-methylcytosine-specific restriction endonuclease McrA